MCPLEDGDVAHSQAFPTMKMKHGEWSGVDNWNIITINSLIN